MRQSFYGNKIMGWKEGIDQSMIVLAVGLIMALGFGCCSRVFGFWMKERKKRKL